MKMCRGKAPFQNYRSIGPRWDKTSGRFRICLYDMSGDKRLFMSYARYMMSVHLGRILSTEEEVDHIDGDRTHDVIANLQLLSKSENSSKTSTDALAVARRVKLMWFKCLHCGRRFELPRSKSHFAKGTNATYCSNSCGKCSHLHRGEVQECGDVAPTFVPKNYGEPWENWSEPIPVAVTSNGEKAFAHKKKVTVCKHCLKPFPASRGKIYCGDTCAREARAKNVPNKHRMTQLFKKIQAREESWTSVGRMYGVSDNAVRKWAKSYSLL